MCEDTPYLIVANCRHYQRLKLRNPFKLWNRGCICDKENHFHGTEKCEVEFETSYAPDRPEIVYCEKCYQQEVYSTKKERIGKKLELFYLINNNIKRNRPALSRGDF